MKIVFNLLLVALALVAGWYFHPSLLRWDEARKAEKLAAKAAEIAKITEEVKKQVGGETAGSDSGTPETPAQRTARELAASLRKSRPPVPDPGTAIPGSSPGMGSDPPPETPPAVAQVDEIEAKYPLPEFKAIEEITKEWSSIPSRAFPRQIKTLVPINLEGPNGKVALPEQSDALAIGMTQGMLVVMRNRQEPGRSMVPLANTDLKATLTALYEKYKTYKIDQVMKQRERARRLKERANGATSAEMALAGPKPSVESGGIITAMLNSLRAKDITETSEERITAWGVLNIENVADGTYWTGTIQCTVDNAIFGPTPTELLALIRDDKVVKWLYSGSKEVVQ